jgi:predicted metal-dependent hydrolase
MADEISNHDLLRHGIELFYKKEYFLCHEVLEKLWFKQKKPEKEFTQGLIQIAVAYYHLQNGNNLGAGKLFMKGLNRLNQFRPTYLFVDVEQIVLDAQDNLLKIEQK